MSKEIEEFLRRAARAAAQQQGSQPRPAPPPQRSAATPLRPLVSRPSQPDVEIVEAQIIDDAPRGISRGDTVAEHVRQHIETSDVAERLSHLGEQVDRSDDRMEEHLHDVFEHKLGALGARTSRASDSTLDDDETPAPARAPGLIDELMGALQSPQGARQAILLAEILGRPVHRW